MHGQNISSGFVSADDFELRWPNRPDHELTIVYTPDRLRGLTDPRQRVAVVDLRSGRVLDEADEFPLLYHLITGGVLASLLLLTGSLIVMGHRGLQKSWVFDSRFAAKKALNEADAVQIALRIRARS